MPTESPTTREIVRQRNRRSVRTGHSPCWTVAPELVDHNAFVTLVTDHDGAYEVYDARTIQPYRSGSPFDPRHGASIHQAHACWRTLLPIFGPGYVHLGFILSPDDPFAAISIHSCRNRETSELTLEAMAILHHFRSRSEVFPNGIGVTILIRGRVPGGRVDGEVASVADRDFIVPVTANRITSMPVTIEPRQDELDSFIAILEP